MSRGLVVAVVGFALASLGGAACRSDGAEVKPADPVLLEGEGLRDVGPRYPGVFDVEGGRTDLDEGGCHAWVQVLPAGAADDGTQQYLITFGLPEAEGDDEEEAGDGDPGPPALLDEACIAERTDIVTTLVGRLAVPPDNLTTSLLDADGARWLTS